MTQPQFTQTTASQEDSRFSSITFILGPGNQTVLVLEESKPRPWFWKCSGGGLLIGETPEEGAIRESKQETGIPPKDLVLLDRSTNDFGHTKHFYFGRTDSWEGLAERGDEGELVRRFLVPLILPRLNFLPQQRVLLIKHRQILARLGADLGQSD